MADRLSVSMALTALSEQVDAVTQAEEHLRRQYDLRNGLIRDARDCGIGYRRLTTITGLSRDRLYTIVNTPDPDGVGPARGPRGVSRA